MTFQVASLFGTGLLRVSPRLAFGTTQTPHLENQLDARRRRLDTWPTRPIGSTGARRFLLEQAIDTPDFEWLMIDASHIKVHPHAAGAVGGNQDMGRTKGGSTRSYTWPWMRMVCRSESLLQRVPRLIARRLSI